MELQNFFYTVAIIFMVLAIGLILSIAIVFFMVYQKLSRLHNLVEKKFLGLIAPAEVAVEVGSTVAKAAAKKVKEILEPKDKSED